MRRALPGLMVVLALFVAARLAPRTLAQSVQGGVKQFESSIVPLPPAAALTVSALDDALRSRKLLLHFAFEPRNFAELESRVAKGEVISTSEMKERYSGSEDDSTKLSGWLKGKGFEITKTTSDFLSVYARGTVSQIEDALGTEMRRVTVNGQVMPVAVTPPKLPVSIAEHVISVSGLQPFVRAVKHFVSGKPSGSQGANQFPPVARPAAIHAPTYTVQDILAAYDATGLSATGKGETVAILIDTVPDAADLKAFWQKSGVAASVSRIQIIKVQGATVPLPPTEGEETLDTEWISGIAPGATIRVYASGSLEIPYLDLALDQINEDAKAIGSLRVVSISLGLEETLFPKGSLTSERRLFASLAALGVNTFASSGDWGSNPNGHTSGVMYPSSDIWVIAVGGTTLNYDQSSKKVNGETAWNGSGGGVSSVFKRPTWQPNYAKISSGSRLVPDVSAVADPVPGAFVWYNGKETPVGGTSWSAPIWAGLYTLITETRLDQGKKRLGFLPPVLYGLAQGIRDIPAGTNGAHKADVGWDPVTGLGVPNVSALVKALR